MSGGEFEQGLDPRSLAESICEALIASDDFGGDWKFDPQEDGGIQIVSDLGQPFSVMIVECDGPPPPPMRDLWENKLPAPNLPVAPLCIHCTHFQAQLFYGSTCARPLSVRRDPVHGEAIQRVDCSAADERRPGKAGIFRRRPRCGPEGIFFQRRERPARPAPSMRPQP